VKSQPEKTEKISITEVDSLIDSIIKANPELTEEIICLELEYNGGYISQLRSREKATGEPQVSTKFYNQLKAFRLQNANYKDKGTDLSLEESTIEYGIKGKLDYIKALLEEKDRAIKKAEAHYEDAKVDKERLFAALNKLQHTFDITLKEISNNLKEAATNFAHNRQDLAQLKDQIYIVSDQLEHQREALNLGLPGDKPQKVSFVKKGKASHGQQQDGGKKNKDH
jgi:uncharacterized protein YukE